MLLINTSHHSTFQCAERSRTHLYLSAADSMAAPYRTVLSLLRATKNNNEMQQGRNTPVTMSHWAMERCGTRRGNRDVTPDCLKGKARQIPTPSQLFHRKR